MPIRIALLMPEPPEPPPPEPPPPPPPRVTFEAVLERTFVETGRDLELRSARLDRLVHDAITRNNFSNAELLALQVAANRFSLELDLLSKIVQQAVQGLRDLLRTQV